MGNKKNFLNRNNVKISFYDEPKFVVNREKGAVTATVFGHLSIPTVGQPYWTDSHIEVRGFGVARLKDDDVFDLEKGKRIAMAKAENNAYNVAATKITQMIRERQEFVDCALNFLEKTNGVIQHNVEYINRIGG